MKEFPLNKEYFVTEDARLLKVSKKGLKSITASEDNSGYKRAWIWVNGEYKRWLLHRIVATTYIPNPDNLPQVNHKDGNKLNNLPNNLEWVTAGDNQRHAYRNNLKQIPNGEKNPRAELTEVQVLSIYNSLLDNVSSSKLSEEFSIPIWHVNKIKHKRIWQDTLKDLPPFQAKKGAERLAEELVHKICKALSEGLTYKETLEEIGQLFTKDQFRDLKRRRGFKHITSQYSW